LGLLELRSSRCLDTFSYNQIRYQYMLVMFVVQFVNLFKQKLRC
jgi:hypothetical protein